MMYRILYNKMEVYGPDLDQAVLNPTLEIELNSSGRLEFTLPVTRSTGGNDWPDDIWRNIQIFRGEVQVFEEDECIWYGRPIQIIRDWNNQKRVVCEGALAYFNDSVQPTKEYKRKSTPLYEGEPYTEQKYQGKGFFNNLIDAHNSQMDHLMFGETPDKTKKFKVGIVDVENSLVWRKTDMDTTADALQNMCLDTTGGYFFLRKEYSQEEEDYINVIDWRKSFPYGADQEIQFGLNLLDINQDLNGSDVCTVLYPTSGDDIFVNHAPKYTEEDPYEIIRDDQSRGHILHEAKSERFITHMEGYKKYGRVVKMKSFDIQEEEDNPTENSKKLFRKAAEWLDEQNRDEVTIECSAADLHYLNGTSQVDREYGRFRVGQMVQIYDEIHGLNRQLPIFKLSINMDSGVKKITIGTPPKKELTDIIKPSTNTSTRGGSGSTGGGGTSGGSSGGSGGEAPVKDILVRKAGESDYDSVIENKIAKINLNALVKNVKVDGQSVVNDNRVANINIPVKDVKLDNVSVVDANGIAQLLSPEIPVVDVQVDGVSVVDEDGIAQIESPEIPVVDVQVDGASVVDEDGIAQLTTPIIPVVDVQVDDVSVVDEDGIAQFDSDDFGKVDDIQIEGQTILSNKVANLHHFVRSDAELIYKIYEFGSVGSEVFYLLADPGTYIITAMSDANYTLKTYKPKLSGQSRVELTPDLSDTSTKNYGAHTFTGKSLVLNNVESGSTLSLTRNDSTGHGDISLFVFKLNGVKMFNEYSYKNIVRNWESNYDVTCSTDPRPNTEGEIFICTGFSVTDGYRVGLGPILSSQYIYEEDGDLHNDSWGIEQDDYNYSGKVFDEYGLNAAIDFGAYDKTLIAEYGQDSWWGSKRYHLQRYPYPSAYGDGDCAGYMVAFKFLIPMVDYFATNADIAQLQSNFQDGVDDIYDACVAKGSTPASTSLSDVVQGIMDIPTSGGGGDGYLVANNMFPDDYKGICSMFSDEYSKDTTADATTIPANTGTMFLVMTIWKNTSSSSGITSITNGTYSLLAAFDYSNNYLNRLYLVTKTDRTLPSVMTTSDVDTINYIPLHESLNYASQWTVSGTAGYSQLVISQSQANFILLAVEIGSGDNTLANITDIDGGNLQRVLAIRYNDYNKGELYIIRNKKTSSITVTFRRNVACYAYALLNNAPKSSDSMDLSQAIQAVPILTGDDPTVITANSYYSSDYAPWKAIDDSDSYWAAAYSQTYPADNWLKINLSEPVIPVMMHLWLCYRNDGDATIPTIITIQDFDTGNTICTYAPQTKTDDVMPLFCNYNKYVSTVKIIFRMQSGVSTLSMFRLWGVPQPT